MVFDDLKEKFPILAKTADYLENNCYFFKAVLQQIRDSGADYEFGEDICKKAFLLNGLDWDNYFDKVHTVIAFSLEFLRLQMDLEKSGKYPYSTFEEVEKYARGNKNYELHGPRHLWAVYFSQFFWVTHNGVFNFFIREFAKKGNQKNGLVLEVPTGNGLFLTHFLINNHAWNGAGVDIADSSIDFSNKVLGINKVSKKRVRLIKKDARKLKMRRKFNRIICGEFLEHLENPIEILKKLESLLEDNGKIFITVAVWAAAADHIFLYKNADEVRRHIKLAGLKIKKEFIQTVFKNAHPEQEKTPVNYCAILTK